MHSNKAVLVALAGVVFSLGSYSQDAPSPNLRPSDDPLSALSSSVPATEPRTGASPADGNAIPPASHDSDKPGGFVSRTVRRGLNDQKTLYAAPFRKSNIKWDALLLAGTGALIATDRRIEKQLSVNNLQRYQNSSNVAMSLPRIQKKRNSIW